MPLRCRQGVALLICGAVVFVALISVAAGLVIGLLAGYLRWLDGFVMRIMDGLMAMPAILMAEGRALFRVFPHNILFPGIFLAATVLAVNIMGDGLRDSLDPRLRKRL